MLFSIVTVTCPGTFGGRDMVEGGAGAMGRLGMVGFGGGCKQKTTRHVNSFALVIHFTLKAHRSNLDSGPRDETCQHHSFSAELMAFSQYRGRNAQTRLNILLRATHKVQSRTGTKAQICTAHTLCLVFYIILPLTLRTKTLT